MVLIILSGRPANISLWQNFYMTSKICNTFIFTLLLSSVSFSSSSLEYFNECELAQAKFWQQIQDHFENKKSQNSETNKTSIVDVNLLITGDSQPVRSLQSELISAIEQQVKFLSYEQTKELLSALEMGIVLEDRYRPLVDITNRLQDLRQQELRERKMDCSQRSIGLLQTPDLNRLMNASLAIAYQSCSTIDRKPLDRFTQDLVGISIIGKHEDGVGNRRVISSVADVVATHPYIKNVSYGSTCFNVAKSPLIYDYGGKPYTTNDNESSLDFFKDMGSGTKVLGIDCSGYVFSILASGGLRLHPTRILKASNVHGIRSYAFLDPAGNGMPCLEKISVGPDQSLQEGDIVAIPGHVVMLESVAKDPFGNLAKKRIEDCDSIDISDFKFNVIQSSPENNAVGINKYKAPDYLAQKTTIRQGLESYARLQCRARFTGKVTVPNLEKTSIVRHKGTPECLTRPVRVERASCVQSCLN